MSGHTMMLSREALFKAVAAVVKEQSSDTVELECIGLNAVLVSQVKGGKVETYPLDTIEVQLARVHPPKVESIHRTPPAGKGKIRLAAVGGEQV